GVDYKDFQQTVGLTGADTSNTPISYVPFSVGYSATAQDPSGVTQLGTSFNFGARGIGDDVIDCFGQMVNEFECKRFKARPNYAYLKGDIARSQALPRGYTLYAKLEGQIADLPLISNEQFTAGGMDSVRGYLEAEQLGDNGARGTVELRTPNLLAGEGKDLWGELTAVAFLDGAHLRVIDPLPSQQSRFTLASGGVGLRFRAAKALNLALDVARAFRDSARTREGDVRVKFRAAYEF